MKNKFLIVGLISLMMVAGFVALSCKDDKPCCTKDDIAKWAAQPTLADAMAMAPKCCQEEGDCCEDAWEAYINGGGKIPSWY